MLPTLFGFLFNYVVFDNVKLNKFIKLQNLKNIIFMTQEVNTLINLMLVNLKLNALKLTLTDKELEIYNNYLLDEAEKLKPILLELKLSREQVDEVLTNFLK